jgi:hypothetical protein
MRIANPYGRKKKMSNDVNQPETTKRLDEITMECIYYTQSSPNRFTAQLVVLVEYLSGGVSAIEFKGPEHPLNQS